MANADVLGVQTPQQQGAYGTNPWTGQPYSQQDANNAAAAAKTSTGLGAFGDLGDSFMGHASYAPGGSFGSNTAADAYNNNASQLGLNNSNLMFQNGWGVQSNMGNLGNATQNTFQNLGNKFANQGASLADYGIANNIGLSNQGGALGMYRDAAQGNGPSAAQAQLQSGLDQSIAAQQSAAASTRGGFGLANAQHNAAMNAGQLQGTAANNAAQLRAQEQQAGMAGYAGLANTIQAQQAANAQFQAQQQQQQRQANAQNTLAAYGQGANYNLGFNNTGVNAGLGYENAGLQNQLGYNQLGESALQSQLNADVQNQNSMNTAMGANAERQQKGAGGILSMIGGLF